jgi:uncharacterized protein YbjT (DUF2867 family)
MRMLVTGGTGFIGSQVVDLLAEEGHEVLVFARRTELPGRWRGRRVALAAGDLADADSLLAVMQGRDVLFHIGELKVTSRSAARKNVRLVERIVGALGASGIGRLVFVSTTPRTSVKVNGSSRKAQAMRTMRSSGRAWSTVRVPGACGQWRGSSPRRERSVFPGSAGEATSCRSCT